MKTAWKADALALSMIIAMFALAAMTWTTAPERVPVHWNWSGDPDRFGGRFEGLLALPFVALVVYLLLLTLPRLDPRRKHYDAFLGPFVIMRTVVVGLLLGLYVVILLWLRGERSHLNTLVAAEVGVAFLLMGNYLPKLKSNWFIGVRTPWTLSSEASWRQTHRLAGWLFSVSGILTIAAAFARPDLAKGVMFGTLLMASAASIVYSYLAWRDDPARTE